MSIRLNARPVYRTVQLRVVAVLLALVSSTSAAQTPTGNDLFQRALALERADGQIGEAITLYERIVKDYPGDRRLVARTLVQLGRVQERRGEAEARKAYARVIREFADQPDAAREARERMEVLTKGAGVRAADAGVASARMALVSDVLGGSTVTADGRLFVFTDSSGNIAMRDIQSGRVTQVTHEHTEEDEFASALTVSDDAQLFAFTWWNGPKLQWELRTADRRTGTMRVLISDTTIVQARPFAITPDQRHILALVTFPGNVPGTLALVDTRSGTRRVLPAAAISVQTRASMSPDGKFVVYDAVDGQAARTREIRIIDVASGSDTVLVQHASDDFDPLWGPNGAGVFFVSTRNGSPAGWFVPVSNGRASGNAALVKADVGTSRVGLTRSGALFYVPINGAKLDVFLGEVDVASGSMTRTPVLVESRTNGSNTFPAWSRDGRYLVYIAGRGREQSVRVRALETGVESEVRASAAAVQLMPDNRSAIIANLDRSTAVSGVYRIELESGATTTIVERSAKTFNIRRPLPSADGRAIYYVLWEMGTGSSIMRRDLATGEERRLYESADWMNLVDHLALSPDGRWLAAKENARENNRPGSRIILIPVSGAPDSVRKLARLDHEPGSLTWTPDGRAVLVLTTPTGRSEMWSVPTDGSAPRRVNANLGKNVSSAQLHPDGRRLLLWIGDYRNELWVAENFLPLPRTNRPR